MRTIALLTDFGYTDNFVGVMKGIMLKTYSRINIIDITHGISSHSIKEGAFTLLKSYRFFPKKTIFLVVIDPGVGTKRKILAIKTRSYYFIGPDNGVLYPAAEEDGIKKAVYFGEQNTGNISATFHGRDVFAPLAAKLAKNETVLSSGKEIKRIISFDLPKAKFHGDYLFGSILYIDKFGNIVTNIKKSGLTKISSKAGFKARLNNKVIKRIYSAYQDAPSNTPFFIEGSFGYLEISLKGNNAKNYFNLKRTDNKIIVSKI